MFGKWLVRQRIYTIDIISILKAYFNQTDRSKNYLQKKSKFHRNDSVNSYKENANRTRMMDQIEVSHQHSFELFQIDSNGFCIYKSNMKMKRKNNKHKNEISKCSVFNITFQEQLPKLLKSNEIPTVALDLWKSCENVENQSISRLEMPSKWSECLLDIIRNIVQHRMTHLPGEISVHSSDYSFQNTN